MERLYLMDSHDPVHVLKMFSRLLRKELTRLSRMEVGGPLLRQQSAGRYCAQGESGARKNVFSGSGLQHTLDNQADLE